MIFKRLESVGQGKGLRTGALITFYRTRKKELLSYFSEEEPVYCKDIKEHLLKMGVSQ